MEELEQRDSLRVDLHVGYNTRFGGVTMESEDYQVALTNEEASMADMNNSLIYVDSIVAANYHSGY